MSIKILHKPVHSSMWSSLCSSPGIELTDYFWSYFWCIIIKQAFVQYSMREKRIDKIKLILILNAYTFV